MLSAPGANVCSNWDTFPTTDSVGGRAGPGRRPVRHHPGGPRGEAARAHAAGDEVRTVIAGYHWFTDWGRDTMISLEGLTLTTGRITRSRLHPAHLRPLRPRRSHPQSVSRRRKRRALSHGRRDALVLPRRSTVTSRRPDDRRRLRAAAPDVGATSSSAISRDATSAFSVDPDGRPAAPGRGRLPAHLDGRQDGRLGGDSAPRQGGRDQRALVQRPAAPRRLAAASGRQARRSLRRPRASARSKSFNDRFWYPRGGYLYDVIDGPDGATRRPAARIRSSPSRSIIRCSAPERWAAVSQWCERELLTPVGLRSLAPDNPITSRLTTATFAPATPPITRARSGPG